MKYRRFFAMIGTSTLVMFGLMYLNTYLISHIFFSETRAYMAILMGAVMAFVMLAFMISMYRSRTANIAIFAGSIAVFALSLWLVRSQVTVQDRSFMRAMIPHHSIAIMTSSRAGITDQRVRKLADEIIYAQDKEIAEMRYLIADITANGKRPPTGDSPVAELKDATEALQSEVVGKVDPEFLSPDEIERVFPGGETCRFTYTTASPPVFVVGEDAGEQSALVKISGDLVRLKAGNSDATFDAEPLSVDIRQTDDDELHDFVLKAGLDYNAGFRGQYRCLTR
ncbi:DUF305 domain-containing protein [Tepidamorphus sp. 3E244]|uniref:DUF305 domain-containing protein n=1 Tax=Tepidamorphus sp. 3E244 TaxID=3385498 RepID=UPI0038FC7EE5